MSGDDVHMYEVYKDPDKVEAFLAQNTSTLSQFEASKLMEAKINITQIIYDVNFECT